MWHALRDMYDGYHFSRGLTDIYNPFSLLNAFRSGELQDKWFDSATPKSLIDTLSYYPFELSNLDNISVYARAFDQPFDDFDSAIPILYQSGYLTIKNCTQDRTPIYTLGIPNREVHNGLYDTLLTHYVERNPLSNQSLLMHVAEAMRRDDIDGTTTVKGVKFYYRTFRVPRDGYTFNIIFNQGTSNAQTVDITDLNADRYYEISSTTNKFTVNDITNEFASMTDITAGDNSPVNVYTIDGRLLRRNTDPRQATLGLNPGIYIVGNKKMVVR